jgi:LytR cell envelope-related transcriptional attenuator
VRQSPAPPSRVARSAARGRRRHRVAAVVAIAVAGAGAVLLWPSGGPEPAAPSEQARGTPTDGLGIEPTTLAISLEGAAVPLIAVARPGGADVPVLTVPAQMSLEIPGVGEATTDAIARQDGEGLRVALSNTVGVWIEHYLVLDMEDLGRIADAAGGVAVTLPGQVDLSSGAVGPGDVTLTSAQVTEYLGIDGPNAFTRWEVILPGLLNARVGGSLGGASDDLAAVLRRLPVDGQVRIDTFPTRISTGQVRVPDYEALDALMGTDFGVPHTPVPVLVQNGTGRPGLAADVARVLVPEGFRVVLSGNASTFDYRETQVVASGDEHVKEAQRARRALGVGVLAVTQVPSGVADLTIVIGKDFKA